MTERENEQTEKRNWWERWADEKENGEMMMRFNVNDSTLRTLYFCSSAFPPSWGRAHLKAIERDSIIRIARISWPQMNPLKHSESKWKGTIMIIIALHHILQSRLSIILINSNDKWAQWVVTASVLELNGFYFRWLEQNMIFFISLNTVLRLIHQVYMSNELPHRWSHFQFHSDLRFE